MNIYSIGVSGKSAQNFFELIKNSGGKKVLDIRINRNSQLSGFAKDRDLDYFLPKLSNVTYEINPMLAPTKELLKQYRSKEIDWPIYAQRYLDLIKSRKIENSLKSVFNDAILMCSEDSPMQCHRRLAAEYLAQKWPGVHITHL